MKKYTILCLLFLALLSGGYAFADCNPFVEECVPFNSDTVKSNICNILGCSW